MEKNKSKNIKVCEICNSNATCLCMKCNKYFCENCFKIIHDLKKDSSHKKDIIDPFILIDFNCPEHPHNSMNLFCIDEKGKLYHVKLKF